MEWLWLKMATQVWAYIGLVHYISAFLPKLSEYTSVLRDLITKEADKHFPPWTEVHQAAFDGIKRLVVSHECLTTIDFTLMPEYNILMQVTREQALYCLLEKNGRLRDPLHSNP